MTRVVLLGDSLSASDTAPGGRLATLLRGAGADVRVNARVGRSAHGYYREHEHDRLYVADKAHRPELVIVWLGTNDIGLSAGATTAAMLNIRDDYRQLGAGVVAIGPPAFAPGRLDNGSPLVVGIMQGVFGRRAFVDARPLSSDLVEPPQRAADGIHFSSRGAQVLAPRLRDALASLGGRRGENWIAALVALGLAAATFAATAK